jgi:hypothetical protein
MEYLDAGRPTDQPVRAPRRWLPVTLGVVTFLVVLVGLGAVVGDWAARNIEMQLLVSQVEESEAAMGELQTEIEDLAAEYKDRMPLNEADQAAFDTTLKEIAARNQAAIAAAGQDVAAVRWLAWHGAVGQAQDAYLAHNRAWQDYLGRAASDPSEFARQQDAINSTFEASEPAVRGALPSGALYDLPDRVDAIFAPPSLPEGTGQPA